MDPIPPFPLPPTVGRGEEVKLQGDWGGLRERRRGAAGPEGSEW